MADEIVLMHEGKVIRHAETMEICQDEEALKEAELEIPTVIRMYRKLTEKKNLIRQRRASAHMGRTGVKAYLI